MTYKPPRNEDEACKECYKLVHFIATKHKKKGGNVDFDDLVQAGWVGVLCAYKNYDPERGRFGAHAGQYIEGEMRMAYYRGSMKGRATMLQNRWDRLYKKEDIVRQVAITEKNRDFIGQFWNTGDGSDLNNKIALETLMEDLSHKERRAIENFLEGHTHRNLNKEFGWNNGSYAARVWKEAVEKMVKKAYKIDSK